jgi:hypothetical protein
MSQPILVTGAAGGAQGSTGRLVASLLMEQGIPVRALVHQLDSRSDELRQQGAEVVEGALLNSASVQAAMRNVERASFTYPVADGLIEAAAIFAAAARDAALELVVNNSQFQGRPGDPAFRDLKRAASFRSWRAVSERVRFGQRNSHSGRNDRSSGESDRTANPVRGYHGRAVGQYGEGAARSSRPRSPFTSLADLPEGRRTPPVYRCDPHGHWHESTDAGRVLPRKSRILPRQY